MDAQTLLDRVRSASEGRKCLLCNEPPYCTNQLCYNHHPKHCTAGGIDSSGHDLKPSIFAPLTAQEGR